MDLGLVSPETGWIRANCGFEALSGGQRAWPCGSCPFREQLHLCVSERCASRNPYPWARPTPSSTWDPWVLKNLESGQLPVLCRAGAEVGVSPCFFVSQPQTNSLGGRYFVPGLIPDAQAQAARRKFFFSVLHTPKNRGLRSSRYLPFSHIPGLFHDQ